MLVSMLSFMVGDSFFFCLQSKRDTVQRAWTENGLARLAGKGLRLPQQITNCTG